MDEWINYSEEFVDWKEELRQLVYDVYGVELRKWLKDSRILATLYYSGYDPIKAFEFIEKEGLYREFLA